MFETILLAVDGSEPSKRATRVAQDLSLKLGSEVVVVHVRERELGRIGGIGSEPEDAAAELIDGTVGRLKDAGVSARGELHSTVFGRAARVILEVANESNAAIVVMGSRGLSDLAGLVMGSVTHKVLHLAHCPVLVVR